MQRVLAHCDRASAVGYRDYAILLLVTRLGLRAGEINFLELDNIDWQAGCMRPPPLQVEVGEAIVAYLQKRAR
jgi:integrase